MSLKGSRALITGGTKGIGLAVAESLVEAGASVTITARTRKDVERVVKRLAKQTKSKVVGIVADVGDPGTCNRIVAEATAAMGGLDILVNNAGLGVFKSIEELTWEEWRQQIDVNLGGVWACTKAAIGHLKKSKDAWVINIGSLASRNSFASGTGYNASKFGLLGMTEAMMLDLRDKGIRVSIVMPGSVNTDFGTSPKEAKRGWKLEADDCALAVMQLLAYPKGAHPSRIELRPARVAKR
jgi:NAD(P)-dependent dehydrogenase (short-subunit alcohol dehydrogenase family)